MCRVVIRPPHGRRFLSMIVLASLSLQMNMASAVDMDIALNDIQRRDAVASYCPALKKSSNRFSTLDDYRKGLCLLYGIRGKARPEKALVFLRKAADSNLVDAQLALADTLQKGSEAEQKEALQWYQRAELAGDVRAAAREARLASRIDASASHAGDAIPDPPPGTIVNPTSREMPALYRDGYHCHLMSFGQKWCHNTMD